jgi:hypothetical protein
MAQYSHWTNEERDDNMCACITRTRRYHICHTAYCTLCGSVDCYCPDDESEDDNG